MIEPLLIAKSRESIFLLPAMANRHGLITGATGTGKTVTLQTLAEGFSRIGVPGLHGRRQGRSVRARPSPARGIRSSRSASTSSLSKTISFAASPVTFWDVFDEQGHPVRSTLVRDGAAVTRPAAQPERNAGGCVGAGVQDRRRQWPAVARPERFARHVAVRRRQQPRISPPSTAMSPPPASVPSSAACWHSISKAATSCSASLRSISPT